MIIYRQREYSSFLTKAVHGFENVRFKTVPGLKNAQVGIYKRLGKNPETLKRLENSAAKASKRVPSRYNIARKTIADRNRLQTKVVNSAKDLKQTYTTKEGLKNKALNTAIGVKNRVDRVNQIMSAEGAGGILNAGVGATIKNPIQVAGTGAGYALQGAGIYIPGSTAMATGLEAGVQKVLPGYKNLTQKLHQTYQQGKTSKIVQGAGNALYYGLGGL